MEVAHQRASDLAYRQLKRDIETLRLSPGAVLNEAALMRELNVGRTPLREALQRLAMDRLVVIMPRQGTIVSDLSIQTLQEIFEVRVNLEGLSCRLAAERGTPTQLEHLNTLLTTMKEVARASDYEALLYLDQQFHRYIAGMSRNSHLEEILDRLNSQSFRFWYLSFTRAGRLDETQAEHQTILEAMATRDGARAQQYMLEHVEQFKRKVMANL